MSTAEKKLEMVKILLDANDELTERAFSMFQEITRTESKFSKDEILMFQKIRDEFIASGEKGYTVEEAHLQIRKAKKNAV